MPWYYGAAITAVCMRVRMRKLELDFAPNHCCNIRRVRVPFRHIIAIESMDARVGFICIGVFEPTRANIRLNERTNEPTNQRRTNEVTLPTIITIIIIIITKICKENNICVIYRRYRRQSCRIAASYSHICCMSILSECTCAFESNSSQDNCIPSYN